MTTNKINETKGKIVKKHLKDSAIRYLLTLLLLITVWQHSHWSVALSITLFALFVEGQAFINMLVLDVIKLVERLLK